MKREFKSKKAIEDAIRASITADKGSAIRAIKMPKIFIERIRKGDTDAYRDSKTEIKQTVDGKKMCCCRKLARWFRLSEFVVKHDVANYILGITDGMKGWKRDFVKWWDYDKETGALDYNNCLEEIASAINKTDFGEDGYAGTLFRIAVRTLWLRVHLLHSSAHEKAFRLQGVPQGQESLLGKGEEINRR